MVVVVLIALLGLAVLLARLTAADAERHLSGEEGPGPVLLMNARPGQAVLTC